MIQLVASDMDGTLLVNHLDIHPDNLQAIQHLSERKIPFMVCSGRNLEMVEFIFAPLGLTCPKILLNGALVYDEKNQLLERTPINKQDARQLLEFARENDFFAELITENGVYLLDMAQRKAIIAKDLAREHPELTVEEINQRVNYVNQKLRAFEIDSFDQLLQQPQQDALKISLMSLKGSTHFELARTFIQNNLPDLVVTSSSTSNLEINHIQAQKGLALARYAKLKGLDMANIMAFGDNYNDASLLELSGYSFAMANAAPEIKALAKYTTQLPNTQGGVAQGIYQFIQ